MGLAEPLKAVQRSLWLIMKALPVILFYKTFILILWTNCEMKILAQLFFRQTFDQYDTNVGFSKVIFCKKHSWIFFKIQHHKQGKQQILSPLCVMWWNIYIRIPVEGWSLQFRDIRKWIGPIIYCCEGSLIDKWFQD